MDNTLLDHSAASLAPSESKLARRVAPLSSSDLTLQPRGVLVHEIYPSIQGESSHAGWPCTFIRTTACHLRCRYCDTAHAFWEGKIRSIEEILAQAVEYNLPMVEVTGGEPLLQPNVLPLLSALCDRFPKVLLETSGACDIAPVDKRVIKIIDVKTPASGEQGSFLPDNLKHPGPQDELKYVLWDRDDYAWAVAHVRAHGLWKTHTVLFSTVFGRLDPAQLAQWIVTDKLPVRLQLQMHKYIWDPRAKGV